MTQHALALRPLAAERAPWLRGRIGVPRDRAISRLALICGAMARGETIVEGLLEAPGVLAMARALQALGARIEKRSGRWHIMGIGVGGFLEPEGDLDFGNSLASLRLAMGLVGIYDFTSRFTGDRWLSSQPLAEVLDPLQALGVKLVEHNDGTLPVVLRGPRLPVPPIFAVPAAAPWLKNCMLLAGLTIPGTTVISEPLASPDHAERLLRSFGAHVERSTDGAGIHTVELDGLPNLRAQRVEVPGDPSLAAFGMVAALIVPGSEMLIEQVSVNPTRSGLLATLLEMGGDIELLEQRQAGGEEIADLLVRNSALTGITVSVDGGPSVPGECAILAVAAAFAEGDTRFEGLDLLAAAERERLVAVGRGLRANGVACEVGPDSMVIRGAGRVPGGGRVITGRDHWLALSFLVLGMAADDQVTIDDQSAIDGHFPGFITALEEIGASFIRYTE